MRLSPGTPYHKCLANHHVELAERGEGYRFGFTAADQESGTTRVRVSDWDTVDVSQRNEAIRRGMVTGGGAKWASFVKSNVSALTNGKALARSQLWNMVRD